MTVPLTKAIRRRARLAGRDYVVELSPDGVTFRELGRRFRVVAPLELTLKLAQRLAGEELRRQRLTASQLRRINRGARVVR